jgi:hypothetical protein
MKGQSDETDEADKTLSSYKTSGESKMEKQELKTTDLFLTTFLIHKGFRFTRTPQLENKLINFYFQRTQLLEEACSQYVSREARVDPLALLESFRTVKALTWEAKKAHKAVM